MQWAHTLQLARRDALPAIPVEEVTDTLRGYPAGKAQGYDLWSMRTWALLPTSFAALHADAILGERIRPAIRVDDQNGPDTETGRGVQANTNPGSSHAALVEAATQTPYGVEAAAWASLSAGRRRPAV
eukprot:6459741-Amphidinium_carterae.1